jgi:hypothetical protein
MKNKFLGLVVGGMLLIAAPVQAAVLTVATAGGDTTATLGGNFSLSAETGLNNGDSIVLFDSTTIGGGAFGVSLSGAAKVTFEYLGSEAGFTNSFTTGAGSFTNHPAPGLTQFSDDLIAGLLDFTLATNGDGAPGSIVNGISINSPLSYAIAVLSDTSVIVLFGDGAGDLDFDDLAVKITVSQVPLPPAVWLLISAILGLVTFTRIRRNGGQLA